MSFYNVQNPTSFSIVSDVRKLLVQPGKLTRFPATQQFSAVASLTAEQLVAGNIVGDTTSAGFTLTLPSAENLITLLLGPGGFDVSSSDIFSFNVFNVASSNNLVIAVGSGGSGSKLIAAAAERVIPVQVSVTVSGGSTTYAYTLL